MQHIGDLFAPFWSMAAIWDPQGMVLQQEIEKVQNRAARLFTSI